MSYQRKIPEVQGSPRELAEWVHAALHRRQYNKRYALVMLGEDRVELVDVETAKFLKIEATRPWDIVGYYLGHQNRPAKLTVDDFAGDIEATLEDRRMTV